VKLAFWLSDVSETSRGNFKVVPGSHVQNWIDGPPRRDVKWPEPEGAIEVCVKPGDARRGMAVGQGGEAGRDAASDRALLSGYTWRETSGQPRCDVEFSSHVNSNRAMRALSSSRAEFTR
jgi:hypothetical protein